MLEAVHGHYYAYKFSMREANSRKKAQWEQDGLKIEFSPVYNRLNFSLENKTGKPVRIFWNKSSMVQEYDSSAIIHGGVSLDTDPQKQSVTLVKNGDRINDFILPLLLIQVKENKLSLRDLYPEKDDELSVKNDWIMHLIGRDLFRLHLIVDSKGKEHDLTFHFYPIEITRGAHSFKNPPK